MEDKVFSVEWFEDGVAVLSSETERLRGGLGDLDVVGSWNRAQHSEHCTLYLPVLCARRHIDVNNVSLHS